MRKVSYAEELQRHCYITLIPRSRPEFRILFCTAVTSQSKRKSTQKFGSHEQIDENGLDLSRPVRLLCGRPYYTISLGNIDRYYIWFCGIYIVDFGVYLQVLARQPDCRLNNTVNRVSNPGILATRKIVVLLYERPHLLLLSFNFDGYLISCCGIYFVDSAVVFVPFCTGSADSPFFLGLVKVNRRNAILSQQHITILLEKQMTSCGVLH